MRAPLLAACLALPLVLVPVPTRGDLYDEYRAMNRAERRLVLRYFWQALPVREAAEEARLRSERAFPALSGQDDPRDALRHALWNGFMTRRLESRESAERWGTAHESDPANPPARRAMDLWNNEQGRERTWAAGTHRRTWLGTRSAFPDDAGIESLLRDALRTGGLRELELVNGARDPQAGALVPTFVP